VTDRFLSQDDLDLRELTEEELYAWWNEWLRMAQATNDRDEHLYSHGVFDRDPHAAPIPSPHPPGESVTAG
jgi:hypothetical protein